MLPLLLELVILNYSITKGLNEGRPMETVDLWKQFTTQPQGDESAKNYSDIFEGIGCFEGEYHITLDPTMSPVMHTWHRVQEELDTLVQMGIITKVDRPVDWVNSFVCVCVCVHACVRACLHACMCVCVTEPYGKIGYAWT